MVNIIFKAALTAIAIAEASPSTRSSYPSLPHDVAKEGFCLQSWGPQEKSVRDGVKLVFVDPDQQPKSYLKKLRSQGKRLVCYIDVGMLMDVLCDLHASRGRLTTADG